VDRSTSRNPPRHADTSVKLCNTRLDSISCTASSSRTIAVTLTTIRTIIGRYVQCTTNYFLNSDCAQKAQTSAKASNLNQKSDLNPDFRITPDLDPDICMPDRSQNVADSFLVGVSHFADCRKISLCLYEKC